MSDDTLVIGVGNEFRNDDLAGLEVVRRLSGFATKELPLGGYELMDAWDGATEVVLVDAMQSGAPPGTITVFDAIDAPLPSGTFTSTHAIGIAETIEMARSLGSLPPRLTVFGIEVASVTNGTTLTPQVESALDRVGEQIEEQHA